MQLRSVIACAGAFGETGGSYTQSTAYGIQWSLGHPGPRSLWQRKQATRAQCRLGFLEKMQALLFLAKHVGLRALCLANRCAVHNWFRGISVVVQRANIIESLFAVSSVLHIASTGVAFRKSGHIHSRRHAVHRGIAPPDDSAPHRRHSRALVDTILLERTVRTDCGSPFAISRPEELIRKANVLYS